MSCAAAMLYHQNRFAVVKPGSRRRPSSQIFSPATRRFDCRHSHTSIRSRNSQPLATTPCARGSVPVMKVDWTVHVTAGVTAGSARSPPARKRGDVRRVGTDVAWRQADHEDDERWMHGTIDDGARPGRATE